MPRGLADLPGRAIIRHTMMQRLIPITSWAVIPAILAATGLQGRPYIADAAPAAARTVAGQTCEPVEGAPTGKAASPSESKDQEHHTGFGPIRAPVEMVGRSMWSATTTHAKSRGCDALARSDRDDGIPHRHVLPPNSDSDPAVLLAHVATAVRPHAPPA